MICGSNNLRVSQIWHDNMASLKSLAKRNDSNIIFHGILHMLFFWLPLCFPAFFCWHPVGTANLVPESPIHLLSGERVWLMMFQAKVWAENQGIGSLVQQC